MKRGHILREAVLLLGILAIALTGEPFVRVARAATVPLFPAGARPTGYKLGLLATACWMGGVWSDAEGVPEQEWRSRDDQRCRDLVVSIYGHFDNARYEQVRANDQKAVGDLLAKIAATEPAATRDRTTNLFRDVAAAQHETMLARRAADRVKIDYDADVVEAKLSADQRTAADTLATHGALEPLLVATDPAASDRRALGLLLALDRMEMARGLPKQLKFYALGHVLTPVFDIAPPPAAALKPNAPPRQGAWLAYLSGASARAGYPVTDGPGLTPKARETLAWTGVGRGFSDRLQRQLTDLPAAAVPELSRISAAVIARIQTERATAEQMSRVQADRGGKK